MLENTLINWSKWTFSVMGQIDLIYHLTGCNENNNIISLVFLPKIHDLNLNMRKYQKNKNLEHYTKHLVCNIQKSQGLESQGKTEELLHTEGERSENHIKHVIPAWSVLLWKTYWDTWKNLKEVVWIQVIVMY